MAIIGGLLGMSEIFNTILEEYDDEEEEEDDDGL